MKYHIGFALCAALAALTAPTGATAHIGSHHPMMYRGHVHSIPIKGTHGRHFGYRHMKGCTGTFMYMKGGKCMDARNKAAAS